MSGVALGLDLGGTKIRAGLIKRSGELVVANTYPTNTRAGREGILESIKDAIIPLLTRARREKFLLEGIGISAAGVINVRSGNVVDATDSLPNWKGTRLGYLLEEEFGLHISTDNDVNCALMGELWKGNAQDFEDIVMLTLGTGLGGALTVGGNLVHGNGFVSGHWGRMEIPHPYRPQHWVPLESLLSGTGLKEALMFQLPKEKQHLYPDGLSIINAYADRDPNVIAAVEDFFKLLAKTIANIRWTVDPQLVLIGGGMINSKDIWWSLLKDYLTKENVFAAVRPATLGNDAGMFGAAKIVFDHFDELKNTEF
ncbi:ROK family protein [Salinivibrio costicola]|jgi:Transcriptional regulator/sugar kinase|uniref:ROK family protein n=1 Tax=Salinivibrio costicola TaxID=51367 RepID=UPI003F724B56